jgi:hypothetical protein
MFQPPHSSPHHPRDQEVTLSETHASQDGNYGPGPKAGHVDIELTGPERAALLLLASVAMFGGAAAAISPIASAVGRHDTSVVVTAAGHGPSIRDQFAAAFEPGVIDPDPNMTGSIGPRPIED